MWLRTWALIAVFLSATENGLAFNDAGHRIVAEIAWQKLSTDQRQAIVAVLRQHPRFEEDFLDRMPAQIASQATSVHDHWIFCHAAVWPDIARDIPNPPRDDFDRPLWHYINLPVFLNADQADAFDGNIHVNLAFALPGGGSDETLWNGVQAVKHSMNVVNSPTSSVQDKAVHYCWLLHVIPDLAQPLHSAALFTEELFPIGDKGGGRIRIRRQGTNDDARKLHSVWDGFLGSDSSLDAVQSAATQMIAGHPAEFNAPFIAVPNDVWSTESQAVAIQFAYGPILADIQDAEDDGGPLPVINAPQTYFTQGGVVARRQAVTAGVRLAGVLAGTVAPPDGPTPFAIGRPGLAFPAVIATRRAPSAATANASREAGGGERSRELTQRVESLEREVARLQALLNKGASAAIVPRRRTLAQAIAAATSVDDIDQCNCGDDE